MKRKGKKTDQCAKAKAENRTKIMWVLKRMSIDETKASKTLDIYIYMEGGG